MRISQIVWARIYPALLLQLLLLLFATYDTELVCALSYFHLLLRFAAFQMLIALSINASTIDRFDYSRAH
jgi:hypothetical protein